MNLPSLLERVRSSFPNVDLSAAQFIDEGMQFAVVIADDRVFRFARDEWGVRSLAQEARVLDLLRDRVELALPRFEHLGADWCAYRFLPGEALPFHVWRGLGESARTRTMHQLGAFLRAVHETPAPSDLGPTAAARKREDWLWFHEELRRELYPKLMRFQRDWAEALFEPVVSGRLSFDHTPVLVDADVGAYHLLFDATRGELVGKIDFGIAGLGDPAVDLACVLSSYGEEGARLALQTYPQAEALLERARFWAGTLELQWAYYGMKKDPEWLAYAHLGTARDLRLPAR